jgi:hypothetical protein
MKQLTSIFILMCVIAIMTSSCTSSAKHYKHSKNHGLIKRGCGGLSRLPKKP